MRPQEKQKGKEEWEEKRGGCERQNMNGETGCVWVTMVGDREGERTEKFVIKTGSRRFRIRERVSAK